ncbi:hypothetical protein [Winogradskya consettensis]|nr:hypothetical protein [Actinoplanes consettensis]
MVSLPNNGRDDMISFKKLVAAAGIGMTLVAGLALPAQASTRAVGVVTVVKPDGGETFVQQLFHTWGYSTVLLKANAPYGLTSGGTLVRLYVEDELKGDCVLTDYSTPCQFSVPADRYFEISLTKRWAGGPDSSFEGVLTIKD